MHQIRLLHAIDRSDQLSKKSRQFDCIRSNALIALFHAVQTRANRHFSMLFHAKTPIEGRLVHSGNSQIKKSSPLARASFLRLLFLSILLNSSLVFSAWANSSTNRQNGIDEDELTFIYGDEALISIAVGHTQPLHKAPSVATIITAADIQLSGARDLDDILQAVPGLHVARSFYSHKALYVFRGIRSLANPQVLMLINGLPITLVQTGDRGATWAGMPVEAIERIEIIRGPGSAVFGADAYAGVINIITKNYQTISPQLTVGAGSFASHEFTLQERASLNGVLTAFSLELSETDGHRERIESDLQSFYDSITQSAASLAPGPINTGKKMLEARIDAQYQQWQFRLGYQGRHQVGTGTGVSAALDPSGKQKARRVNVDLSYQWEREQRVDEIQLGYFNVEESVDLNILPAGFTLPIPGLDPPIEFADGMIGQPDYSADHYSLQYSSLFSGFTNHQLRWGAGSRFEQVYRVAEIRNFDQNGLPLGQLVDVSNDPSLVFAPHAERRLHYLFAQDEWAFANDWSFTLGARIDDFSDFGNTFNPRLALVWQMNLDWTGKILYGRAFRAPSFLELYNQNNPVVAGNPDLAPETIDSLEFALGFSDRERWQWDINTFLYQMDDVIRLVRQLDSPLLESQNSGRQRGYGVETEIRHQTSKRFQWLTNLSWVSVEDRDSGFEIEAIPQWQAYLKGHWRLDKAWDISADWFYVGSRQRAPLDPREPLASYDQVNVTTSYRAPGSPWQWQFALRNAFDSIGREPADDPQALPNDIPLAGRQWLIQLSYRL